MTFLRSLHSGICVGLVTMALTAPAIGASVMVSPQSAVVNSGDTFPGLNIADTYNQNGLQNNFVSGSTIVSTYLSTNPLHNLDGIGQEWFSNSPVTSASVTYDLGAVLNLGALILWNEDSTGIGKFNLSASTGGGVFNILLAGVTPDQSANPFVEPYAAQLFSFASVNARYLRIDMLECPGQGGYAGCAIGEVAVAQINETPLPGAVALFASGLAVLGLVGRRKKRNAEAGAATA